MSYLSLFQRAGFATAVFRPGALRYEMNLHRMLLAMLFVCALGGLLIFAYNGWQPEIISRPTKITDLHGQTDNEVFDRLGAPDHEYAFTMDEPLGEFQVELYNTYPPGSPDNKNVQIRECTWQHAHHRVTVWFHKPHNEWVALDSCRYGNDVVF